MEQNRKKFTTLFRVILLISVLLFGYFLVLAFTTNPEKQPKAFFLAFEMLLGVMLLFVPILFQKIFHYQVPTGLTLLYWVFIYCAVFIGTGFGFYGKFYYWDKLLHISSSMLLVALGFAIMGAMVEKTDTKSIPPVFFALFSFTFGVTMGVFWEFYEFSFDGLLHLNMQRFATSGGVNLIGRVALFDTMGDLVIDALGSLLFAIYGYLQLRKDASWLQAIAFKKVKKK